MINLPNGCSCSKLSVYPKNWQTNKAKISIDWYIIYRFYDPNYMKPKQVMVKGMNLFKSIAERQEATQNLLVSEMDKLVMEKFNPFQKLQGIVKNNDVLNKDMP